MEKFIVTPKEDKSVTMTIRIDRALQEEYNDLATLPLLYSTLLTDAIFNTLSQFDFCNDRR